MTPPRIPRGPSAARLVGIAAAFLLLGIGAWTIGWLSATDLLRGWGRARVTFGPGMFATPLAGAFMIAVAACALRAIPARRQPIEMMGRGTFMLGAAALLSIVLAPIAGSLVAMRLEAAGYRRCEPDRPTRFGFGTWHRGGCPPAAGSTEGNGP